MESEQKHILYLTHDGLTDPLGESQIIPYLEGLSEMGYHIQVISLEKEHRVELRGKEVKRKFDAANIDWVPLHYNQRIPVWSSYRNYKKLLRKAEKIVKTSSVQVVHCRSYLAGLCGYRLKQKFGVKFLFDIRGFWADERIEGGIWNLKNPVHQLLYNYFKKSEKNLFTKADHVISLTTSAKSHIEDQFKVDEAAITVIPCCADEAFFQIPEHRKNTVDLPVAFHTSPEDFILGYAGSLGTWYMVKEMVAFFEVLHQNRSDSKFFIASNDDCPPWLAQNPLYGKSIFLHNLSRDQMPGFYNVLDASVFFIRPTFSKMASSPTKLAELMMMGVPVVVNAGVGDQDTIVKNANAGIVLSSVTTTEFESGVKQLMEFVKAFDSKSSVAYACEHFSLSKGVKLYDAVYRNL